MRELALLGGEVALIDDCDYDRVAAHIWRARQQDQTSYAIRKERRNGVNTTVYLHRFISESEPGTEVDHVNGHGLDCQRSNLRSATRQQNCRNQGLLPRNTSGFKGVSWDRCKRRWRASIMVNQRNIHILYTRSKEEAARAYDAKARELFGEFARLNFPEAA